MEINLKRFLILPATIWIVIFFAIPVGIMLSYSFFTRGEAGRIEYIFTFQNFHFLGEPLYLNVFVRTFSMAIINTVLCLIAAFPIAYNISTNIKTRYRNLFLILIILPFCTNFLIRTFSWVVILGEHGFINSWLKNFHLINEPLNLLYTRFSIGIGLFYNYVPFMILPIYSSIEKIDKTYYWAAGDLGANGFEKFRKITVPLALPGILSGSFFVFISSLGEFVTPDLLGGGKINLIGNLIKDDYMSSMNWPLGSALVFVLFSSVVLFSLLKRVISLPETIQ
jgi:spermidine/putrescine transport system permease protein